MAVNFLKNKLKKNITTPILALKEDEDDPSGDFAEAFLKGKYIASRLTRPSYRFDSGLQVCRLVRVDARCPSRVSSLVKLGLDSV